MTTQDKAKRTVAVYFETVEEKEELERDAKRLGIGMSKLIKMALGIGKPVVVKNMEEMLENLSDTQKTITGKKKSK